MKILLASRNKKKIRELETLLASVSSDRIEILSLDDIGFHDEIEETGETFEENSLIKANTGAGLGYITVADDSGLAVDALDGAPGVYSARYSGEGATDEKNNAKLLASLEGLPAEKRSAKFVSVVVCAFPDGSEPIVVRGECPGIILTEARGSDGFGYDPLFLYGSAGKTFAELTADEKNAVSHRGRAMKAFAEAFKLRMHS
ncbi:MAG: XTP/dITP diphosphatase [Clostridia bacterium]|nr:XTP/dITP diphosphatase [Clostridia bacterium]